MYCLSHKTTYNLFHNWQSKKGYSIENIYPQYNTLDTFIKMLPLFTLFETALQFIHQQILDSLQKFSATIF